MHGYIQVYLNVEQFENLKNCISGYGYTRYKEGWHISVFIPYDYVNVVNYKVSW